MNDQKGPPFSTREFPGFAWENRDARPEVKPAASPGKAASDQRSNSLECTRPLQAAPTMQTPHVLQGARNHLAGHLEQFHLIPGAIAVLIGPGGPHLSQAYGEAPTFPQSTLSIGVIWKFVPICSVIIHPPIYQSFIHQSSISQYHWSFTRPPSISVKSLTGYPPFSPHLGIHPPTCFSTIHESIIHSSSPSHPIYPFIHYPSVMLVYIHLSMHQLI